MNNNNINFDIIITIRPDTDVYDGLLNTCYVSMLENTNMLYVATHPRFDIYNQGAIPDALLISNFDVMVKLLKFPDFRFISIHKNIIHPETATGKNVKHQNICVKYLNLSAFRSINNIRP